MTDLADFLRARYLEIRAEEAPHGPDCDSVPAAQSCCGYEDCDCGDRTYPCNCPWPARVTADMDAKLALLDDLLAELHHVNDGDCWYTCAAATEDRDGGETCDDDRHGKPCDCGRDARVERRLRILVQPFNGHSEFKEGWRA